jgi:iron complex transport system substrate-binding protein
LRRVFCEVLDVELKLADNLRRIISLSPAATETLFELGLGGNVVGVSAFCVRPAEVKGREVIGSYSRVDLARLSELKPDLIFTVTGYQRVLAFELAKLGFPVYALELPVSVAGILDFITKIGLVTAIPDRARQMVQALLSKLAETPKTATFPQVYVEIDFSEPVTFGSYSYITDAIASLGGHNIYGEEPSEWLRPDFAHVAQIDPDVIIYEAKMFKPFTERELAELVQSRLWSNIRAVREERVFLTPRPFDFLAHHGPSFITQVIPWISERIIMDH